LKGVQVKAIMPPKKKPINQVLFEAVVAKNIADVEKALENGADPNTFRVPTENGNRREPAAEFRTITEKYIEHHNDADFANERIPGSEMHKHRDYVSVMMIAAQNHDIPMLELLAKHGANINLAQPTLTYADGNSYGEMTPICYALNLLETTKWFIDNGADVDINICGLPGYEDIPCPNFTPLLLASEILKNDAVSRLLVEHGADVNEIAERNNGCQGSDTRICSYWRSVVESGDVAWAERLLKEYDACARWPEFHIDLNKIRYVDCHPGFRETVLMTAVHRRDLPMVQLLLAHGANPNAQEHINLCEDRMLILGFDPESGETEDYCKNRPATALSLALGNASVPDEAIDLDSHGCISFVREPYCQDPIVSALIAVNDTKDKTHVAAARYLCPSDNIADIMPTQEEIDDWIADLSAERRATYTRIKAEKLAEGLDEETTKKAALDAATADPEYDEDPAYYDVDVDFIDRDTDDIQQKIRDIYKRHNPEKLAELPSLFEKYRYGREDEMLEEMCHKYLSASALLEAKYTGFTEEYSVINDKMRLVYEGMFCDGVRTGDGIEYFYREDGSFLRTVDGEDDSSDDDSDVSRDEDDDYDEEVYEFDDKNRAIIMDVDHE
jgi:ankyrin repeat protein